MSKFKEKMKSVREYLFKDDRKLSFRILFGAFTSFTFVLNFFLYGPLEVYLGNSLHFVYTLSEILLPVLLTGAGVFAALFFLSVLLRGRLFNWYITLLGSVSFASFIQVLFMNKSVGLLDGEKIQWEHLATSAVFGLAVWAMVVVLFFAILNIRKNIWKFSISVACILICLTQISSVLSVALTCELDEKHSIFATSEGDLELSDKTNVVILSLDSMDIRYTEEVMKNSPEYFDEFDGFTWYKNTIACNSRTYPNIAVYLTGEPCLYDKSYEEYMQDAWADNKFLEDIAEAGFDSRIYIDSKYVNTDTEYMSKYVSNYVEADRNAYSVQLEKNLITLSLYRSLPVALKPFFEIDTSQINNALGAEGYELVTVNDNEYYDKLKDEGLSVKDKGKGTFTYFHFRGCHAPYRIDANCQLSDKSLTIKDATRGALTNVSEYLKQMKEQGVYDSSTIIVTTDHGYTGSATELERERVVTLFYKPANSRGEIVINNSPQQLSNIRPTVLKALGLDYSAYGTPFDEVAEDSQIKRYFYMSGANESGTMRECNLLTYRVLGDANDFSNWKLIEKRPIEFPFLNG